MNGGDGERKAGRVKLIAPEEMRCEDQTAARPGNRLAHGAHPDIAALAKGLRLLRLFDGKHRERTLEELFQATGLPRMTAYRMVRTLQATSFLVLDSKTKRYHLGPAMIATTYAAGAYAKLVEIARPHLCNLAERTGEATALAVQVDGVGIWADMVSSSRPLRHNFAVGQIIDGLEEADGEVLAAFGNPADTSVSLEQLDVRFNEYPCCMVAEPDEVAGRALAPETGTRTTGVCAVAAPVRDRLGKVTAALSIVVPSGRFQSEDEALLTQEVKLSVAEVSALLSSEAWTAL